MERTSLVFSLDELAEISKCSSVKGISAWLKKNKVPFAVGPDGQPRVARSVFNPSDENLFKSDIFHELFEQQMIFDRRCVGIYMLLRESEVVYIGRTTTFFVRMAAHDKGDFDWDRVVFCPTEKENLEIYEAELIARHSPEYNVFLRSAKKSGPRS